MNSLLLQGCGTALVTPFTADGAVDYEAYAALVDRQVAGGVHFLVPLATTGETPTLSQQEKVAIFQTVKAHAKGLPLLVGVGVNSLPDTLANISLLEPLGPDALLVVVPYYNKPTQQGQYEYFKAVAVATSLPIIIYNVPGRTGANMLPDTVLRLAQDVPNIRGIKEASGKYDQVSEILRRAPEGFAERRRRHDACIHGDGRARRDLRGLQRGAEGGERDDGSPDERRLCHRTRTAPPPLPAL